MVNALGRRNDAALIVEGSLKMNEKRRWCRVKPQGQAAQNGNLIIEQRPAVACRVVDTSAGGACLELLAPCDLPKRFVFVHGATRKVCTLVWKRGFRIGVQYEANIRQSLAGADLARTTKGTGFRSREKF
jgi:hypothetical protein